MTYTESRHVMSGYTCAAKLLTSALAKEGIVSRSEFSDWLESRTRADECEIKRVPLTDLKEWYFKDPTGTLAHRSGKFFTIEGISVQTNYGPTPHWMQPIINQPEVGILGFLTKEFDGTLHFLVQLKMEPGNVNFVQLSPTLQATRSNYTQVHGGSRPHYLDYFLDKSRTRVLVDQLQPEQGSRFLHKFNRNMVVEVDPGEPVPVREDFCWLTLGQLVELTKVNNLVNMDTRTVLSCVGFAGVEPVGTLPLPPQALSDPMLQSSLADERLAHQSLDDIYNWLEWMKGRFRLEVKRVPLNRVEGWVFDGEAIRHRDGRFFSVIGVSVAESAREVRQWDQPMVQSSKDGVVGFLCQKKNDTLHFLVQGMVEPGNVGVVKLGPTVQCTPSNYDPARPESLPCFLHEVVNAAPQQILFSAIHSEEGGRFFHDQRRYLVIEVEKDAELQLPENYLWMTLNQIKHLIQDYNCFNIEARALIACLGVNG